MQREHLVANVRTIRPRLGEVLVVGGVSEVARVRKERNAVDHVPAGVIDVQVGEEHGVDVLRPNAGSSELPRKPGLPLGQKRLLARWAGTGVDERGPAVAPEEKNVDRSSHGESSATPKTSRKRREGSDGIE